MFKHKVIAATLGVLMIVPMFASASTTTDAQSQVQSLLAQIKVLQEQLRSLISTHAGDRTWQTGTTTPGTQAGQPCFMPGRRLGLGTQGDDVKGLQEILKQDKDNEFEGEVTGFFGPRTQRAMMRFHKRMGISSSTDGSVGQRTQDFFKKHCDQSKKDDDKDDGMMNSRGHVSGTIKTNGVSSITVETLEGKSIVVNFTASTTIRIFVGSSTKPTAGAATDLLVGKKIKASGPKNSDGSINAVHITVGDILPMIQMMMDEGKGMEDRKGKNDQGRMMHDMMSDADSNNGNGKGR